MRKLSIALLLCLTASAQNPVVRSTAPTGPFQFLQTKPDLTANWTDPFEFLVSKFDFTAQAPGGTLSIGVPATIALSPCPWGVNGADANHYYRLAGTGTPEPVLGTGGTCTSGATSGTLTFTPAQNHSAGWTITSDSGGLREAVLYTGGNATLRLDRNRTILTSALNGVTLDKDNLVIIGDGPNSVIKARDSAASNIVVYASACNGCALVNFAIDGNRANSGTNPVFGCALNLGTPAIGGANHTIVHRLEIKNSALFGILLNDTSTGVEISSNYIHNNGGVTDATGGGTGIYVYWVAASGHAAASAVRILDNYISENHNTITTAGSGGAAAWYASDLVFSGNYALNNYNNGGQVVAVGAFGPGVIANNTIELTATGLTQGTSGIEVSAVHQTISGNTIVGHEKAWGIALEGDPSGFGTIGASDTNIFGNYIQDAYMGIGLINAGGIVRGTMITGNRIATGLPSGGTGKGVGLDSAAAGTTINANNFLDTPTPIDDQSIDGAFTYANYPMAANLVYAGSIASADALSMRCGQMAKVTGAITIRFITLPADTAGTNGAGCIVGLIQAGTWVTGTSGAISVASAPSTGQTLLLVSDGVYFNPVIGSGGGGGGTPSGPDTSMQSNSGGTFFGDSNVLYVRQVSTPAAPVVTNIGTPGSTSYTYQLVAGNGVGTTANSTSTVTTTGNATLDGTNYNRIATLASTGVTYYKVYRVASGGTPSSLGFVGTALPGSPIDDQGVAGDGTTAPIVNTTIGLKSVNGFTNGTGPAIMGSQFGLNYNNPSGVNVQLLGQFIANATLQPSYIVNATGSDFGQLGNWSSTSWFLGYGPNSAMNGTRALEWNSSGLVYVPGSFKVGTSSGSVYLSGGTLSIVPGAGTNCVHVDGSSAACGGGGSATFTGGLISATSPFTVAGTSGGIVYFSSASTWASSGVLGANLPLFGGGAGASPIAGTRSGNTTKVGTVSGTQVSGKCLEWDASGNIATAGSNASCGSGGTGNVTTGVTLTANLPVLGNGTTDTIIGAREGNTTKYQTFAGADPTASDCAQFDSNHNLVTAGAPCGAGSTNATQLQSRALAATAPADTNVICWDAGGSTWKPCTSAGGGASSVSQLTDWQAVWTSASVLTVTGGNCGVGNTATNVSGTATLTISAGSGTVRGSCDKSVFPPTLKIYNGGLTVVCSGMSCNNVAGSAYGPDDSPAFQWTATAGAWDNSGGTSWRGIIGGYRSIAGQGILKTVSNGTVTDAIDPTAVTLYVPVPGASTDACTPGSIAMNTTHLYACQVSGAWRRVALSTF